MPFLACVDTLYEWALSLLAVRYFYLSPKEGSPLERRMVRLPCFIKCLIKSQYSCSVSCSKIDSVLFFTLTCCVRKAHGTEQDNKAPVSFAMMVPENNPAVSLGEGVSSQTT